MNAKYVITGLISFVAGAVLVAIVGISVAPGMMINESESLYSYDDTVEIIQTEAEALGWKIPAVHVISNSVASGGYDVAPVTVIELCKVDLAGQILSDDESRVVSSMMPCRIAVYETSDGNVIVSRMNTGLISKLFGGDIERLMADATSETEQILGTVLPH
ncbi:MAG: DUF302 domain-containing protein [Candidatus Aegiribacteria sp.]|nr:DUF302 domain-containing protein [Candidatus Aegiribacteria sp.]